MQANAVLSGLFASSNGPAPENGQLDLQFPHRLSSGHVLHGIAGLALHTAFTGSGLHPQRNQQFQNMPRTYPLQTLAHDCKFHRNAQSFAQAGLSLLRNSETCVSSVSPCRPKPLPVIGYAAGVSSQFYSWYRLSRDPRTSTRNHARATCATVCNRRQQMMQIVCYKARPICIHKQVITLHRCSQIGKQDLSLTLAEC